MVAIVHTGGSVEKALRYNESKVAQGVACCIAAENYPLDLADLSWPMKVHRLRELTALNDNVARKALHISVNFSPSERLTIRLLQRVARSYMAHIGYGGQPYLVYQHFDAGHPHIHLVSVTVDEAGQRLAIPPGVLMTAQQSVIGEFGLTAGRPSGLPVSQPAPIQRLHYGATPTTPAMGRIIDFVFKRYLFGSFEEMNALMGTYGIVARRGTGKKGGADYWVCQLLDAQGKKRGVPVKASCLPAKPTLAWLEARCRINRMSRKVWAPRVKNAVHWILRSQHPENFEGLREALALQSIQVLEPAPPQRTGRLYVDHRTGGIYTDRELGVLPDGVPLTQTPIKQDLVIKKNQSMQPRGEAEAADTLT